MTIQIKQVVDEILEELEERLPPSSQKSSQSSGVGNNNSTQTTNEMRSLLNEQAIRFESELRNTNDKLDRLTDIMTVMLGGREKISALLSEQGVSNTSLSSRGGNQTLPSIFELKPNLFRHEKK